MAEKEYIEREAAYDMDTLYDWYVSSVSENDNPVWTEEHLEELLNDFYVIPKDTPAADVTPVRHGNWKQARYTEAPLYICSECDITAYKPHKYCPECGAKMDGE